MEICITQPSRHARYERFKMFKYILCTVEGGFQDIGNYGIMYNSDCFVPDKQH